MECEIRLAKQYGRYGYINIAKLVAVEGRHVNHEKVERLFGRRRVYNFLSATIGANGFITRTAQPSVRMVRYTPAISASRRRFTCLPGNGSNDFVHDKLNNGRSNNMATVLDKCIYQCLCVTGIFRVSSAEVCGGTLMAQTTGFTEAANDAVFTRRPAMQDVNRT